MAAWVPIADGVFQQISQQTYHQRLIRRQLQPRLNPGLNLDSLFLGDAGKFFRHHFADFTEIDRLQIQLFPSLVRLGKEQKLGHHIRNGFHFPVNDRNLPPSFFIQMVPLQEIFTLHQNHADWGAQLMGNVAGKLLFPLHPGVDGFQQPVKGTGQRVDFVVPFAQVDPFG